MKVFKVYWKVIIAESFVKAESEEEGRKKAEAGEDTDYERREIYDGDEEVAWLEDVTEHLSKEDIKKMGGKRE